MLPTTIMKMPLQTTVQLGIFKSVAMMVSYVLIINKLIKYLYFIYILFVNPLIWLRFSIESTTLTKLNVILIYCSDNCGPNKSVSKCLLIYIFCSTNLDGQKYSVKLNENLFMFTQNCFIKFIFPVSWAAVLNLIFPGPCHAKFHSYILQQC